MLPNVSGAAYQMNLTEDLESLASPRRTSPERPASSDQRTAVTRRRRRTAPVRPAAAKKLENAAPTRSGITQARTA